MLEEGFIIFTKALCHKIAKKTPAPRFSRRNIHISLVLGMKGQTGNVFNVVLLILTSQGYWQTSMP